MEWVRGVVGPLCVMAAGKGFSATMCFSITFKAWCRIRESRPIQGEHTGVVRFGFCIHWFGQL